MKYTERNCQNEIQFQQVDDLVISIDATALKDNHKAGNISNGYIKPIDGQARHKFFLYLVDGIISLTFSKLIIIS